MTNNFHKSVLLKESIELLNIKKDQKYSDATLGGGGHTFKILEMGGVVLGMDTDPEAIEYVKSKWLMVNSEWKKEENLFLVKGNFKDIKTIAKSNNFDQAQGIIFDLGLSSHQLDKPERGFSFKNHVPLDMRMNPDLNVLASDLVNNLDERRLYEVFKTYGEEELALPISRSI